jgi:hypothetical protein
MSVFLRSCCVCFPSTQASDGGETHSLDPAIVPVLVIPVLILIKCKPAKHPRLNCTRSNHYFGCRVNARAIEFHKGPCVFRMLLVPVMIVLPLCMPI